MKGSPGPERRYRDAATKRSNKTQQCIESSLAEGAGIDTVLITGVRGWSKSRTNPRAYS